jgi:signal transduction histidine kinase
VQKSATNEAEALDKKALEGYVYHNTTRLRKNGSLVPVAVSAAPIIFEGRPTGIVAMYKDISDLKDAEKRLETMNEKLQVVGKLTRHDARNKLSVINGNAYLTKKELAGDNKVMGYLKDMETSIQQILRIFDFAADYEMLGAQELTYIDVGKTIEETVSLFPNLKPIEVVNGCHGLTVLADSLLRQLFYNFIDNSLEHGEKTSQIQVYYEKAKDSKLRLIYEDDGVGVPPANKPNLFKEGYSTGGSTGHGLYLIKKMMEVYGWTIRETGKAGKGAQFTITIPRFGQNSIEKYRIVST